MITFPVAWEFRDFVYLNDANPIQDWYHAELSDEARETFDSALKSMYGTANHQEWVVWRGLLRGEARQYRIWEIGFRADNKQYRVFGSFGGERRQVILLVGCYHKQKVYTPADAISTAIKRVKLLAEGKAKTNERPIRTDL